MEYTKAQQYNQALQRYLTLSDKYRERPLGKVSTPELPTTTENHTRLKPTLYQTLPPTLRSKGAALLNHLESIPGIKWDKQQLVVDDKPIPKSNVVDLIDDLVRDRKTIKPPPGWSELATVLKTSQDSESTYSIFKNVALIQHKTGVYLPINSTAV